MEKSIKEGLERLTALVDSTKTEDHTPALQVEDFTDMANAFLNSEAKEAMTRKSQFLTNAGNTCVYFGIQIADDNIDYGLKILADIANDMAERKLITKVLAPISGIKLARIPMQKQTSILFFYPLVPDNKLEFVRNFYKYQVKDVCNPEPVGDLKIQIEKGDFVYNCQISSLNLIGSKDPEQILEENIEKCLKILPEGTVVRSITKCAIVSLSIPYQIIFHNSLMSDIKEVQFLYARHCSVVGETVKQFNLITGITYLDKDGKDIHGPINKF